MNGSVAVGMCAAIGMTALMLSTEALAWDSATDPETALHDWQVRRLMHPTPRELRDEQSGRVYIYDGLTDREVDQALENNFDRIKFMMFVGTVKTDEEGDPLIDSQTGRPVHESGGCDN
ncbi:MAG: hypothetical protein WBX11_00750 [Thiobacillaceae bacterium]